MFFRSEISSFLGGFSLSFPIYKEVLYWIIGIFKSENTRDPYPSEEITAADTEHGGQWTVEAFGRELYEICSWLHQEDKMKQTD